MVTRLIALRQISPAAQEAFRGAAGMTLPELLVALVITGGIATAFLSLFLAEHRMHFVSQSYIQVQWEARRGSDAMVKELYRAGHARKAGGAVDGVDFTNEPQIDFQIDNGFDAVACAATGGVCWGDGTTNDRWLHYLVDTTDPTNGQLVRCSTALQGDPIVFSTCSVLANYVQSFLISYTAGTRIVSLSLQIRQTSQQLPGGAMSATPTPLMRRVKLRNPP